MKTKTLYRFTIADYKEEEQFLQEQHRQGWKLIKLYPPIGFVFEECEPEDYVYQLDFPQVKNQDTTNYLQLFEDCDWEYIGKCLNWYYFRKPEYYEEDLSIFSDPTSKIEMIQRIVQTRMLPLLIILLCCLLPNISFLAMGTMSITEQVLFFFLIMMFGLYVYLLIHCGLKLKRLKEAFEHE